MVITSAFEDARTCLEKRLSIVTYTLRSEIDQRGKIREQISLRTSSLVTWSVKYFGILLEVPMVSTAAQNMHLSVNCIRAITKSVMLYEEKESVQHTFIGGLGSPNKHGKLV